MLVSCCFGRNFEVHTRFVFDPKQITQIPYKSHIALPYKHSKLAEIAKLRPGTSEKEDTIGRLRASRYEQGSLISHFVPLFWMNVAFSSIPEKLKNRTFAFSNAERISQKLDRYSRISRFRRHFYFQRLGILACYSGFPKETPELKFRLRCFFRSVANRVKSLSRMRNLLALTHA